MLMEENRNLGGVSRTGFSLRLLWNHVVLIMVGWEMRTWVLTTISPLYCRAQTLVRCVTRTSVLIVHMYDSICRSKSELIRFCDPDVIDFFNRQAPTKVLIKAGIGPIITQLLMDDRLRARRTGLLSVRSPSTNCSSCRVMCLTRASSH